MKNLKIAVAAVLALSVSGMAFASGNHGGPSNIMTLNSSSSYVNGALTAGANASSGALSQGATNVGGRGNSSGSVTAVNIGGATSSTTAGLGGYTESPVGNPGLPVVSSQSTTLQGSYANVQFDNYGGCNECGDDLVLFGQSQGYNLAEAYSDIDINVTINAGAEESATDVIVPRGPRGPHGHKHKPKFID